MMPTLANVKLLEVGSYPAELLKHKADFGGQ